VCLPPANGVVFSLGTRRLACLTSFGDLLFNLLCLALVVRQPQVFHLARYFGTLRLSPFHFLSRVICNLYVQVVQLCIRRRCCRHHFRFLVLPVADALSRARLRNSPLRSITFLDFIQSSFFGSLSTSFSYTCRTTNLPVRLSNAPGPCHLGCSLMYDVAWRPFFLLRAPYQFPCGPHSLRQIRVFSFCLLATSTQLPGRHLQPARGTRRLDRPEHYSDVIVGTWITKNWKYKCPPFFNELIGNRLFPILFGFLVLVLSLYIAQERLSRLVIVAISFFCSSLRLVIANKGKTDPIGSANRNPARESVEQQLRPTRNI